MDELIVHAISIVLVYTSGSSATYSNAVLLGLLMVLGNPGLDESRNSSTALVLVPVTGSKCCHKKPVQVVGLVVDTSSNDLFSVQWVHDVADAHLGFGNGLA
jgi:hypothetical protein